MSTNQASREEWDLFSFGSDGSDSSTPDLWPANPAFGEESEWFLQSANGVESLVRVSHIEYGPFVPSMLPKSSGDESEGRRGRYGGGCHCLAPDPREVQLPDGLGIREDCNSCKKFIRFSVWNGSDGNHPFRPKEKPAIVTPDPVPDPPADISSATRRPAAQSSLFDEPAVTEVQDSLRSTLDEFFKRA